MTEQVSHATTDRIERLRNELFSPKRKIRNTPILITDFPEDLYEFLIVVRKAKLIEHVLSTMEIEIPDDELIVGSHSAFVLPSILTEEEREQAEKYRLVMDSLSHFHDLGLVIGTENVGHVIVDYEKVLKRGFKGIKEDAQRRICQSARKDEQDFLKAVIVLCDAIGNFATRYAAEAEKLSKIVACEERRKELQEIARICGKVPRKPSSTFHEALQSFWFVHIVLQIESGVIPAFSMGRFDQYMYPFYKADIEQGRITKSEAQELLECLWLKFAMIHLDAVEAFKAEPNQLITIGGMGADERDLTNDLTFMCIEATRKLRLVEPKLVLRVHRGTPERLLLKSCELLELGMGFPAFNGDEITISALRRTGIPLRDAINYGLVGCTEATTCGKEISWTVSILFNLAKCLELALNQGRCMLIGEQLGVRTGDPINFKSFEDLAKRFFSQVRAAVKLTVEYINAIDEYQAKYNPTPFLSSVLEDCVSKAKDVTNGGARYNFTSFNFMGLATVADSLAAIKKFIFEEGKILMAELLEALRTNFEGREHVRQMLRNKAPKYGNDDDYVDSIAKSIGDLLCIEVERYNNPRGGRYRAGYFTYHRYLEMGKRTAATPDGRKAREPLSNGISPVQGCEIKGPTAVIKSVTKLNYTLSPNGAPLTLNFLPPSQEDAQRHEIMGALIRTFFDLGGMFIHFNFADNETLKKAKQNPDQYRNLVVRVAAFSAYFVTLEPELQDEIIARNKHQLT